MRTKNKLFTLLLVGAGTTASIAAINKCIKISAISKNLLSEPYVINGDWETSTIQKQEVENHCF